MLSIILPALLAIQPMQASQPESQYRAERVRDNVYVVYGQGGNVGVIVGNDHLILIDCQFEHGLPALLAAVKSISDKPIKYLINTHHHGDHVGGNRLLARQVQGIIAHTNVKARLSQEQENMEPEMRGGMPDLLIGESDPKVQGFMTMVLGNQEIHIAHFGAAHTDSDVAVGIPSVGVIHLGDMLFLGRLPYIDTGSGGSFDGLAQVIGYILSWLPDDTYVIPGHGQVCSKKELTRHHAFLMEVQRHVRKNPEMSLKELADSFDKAPWGDKEPSDQFVNWEALFGTASGKGPGRVIRN